MNVVSICMYVICILYRERERRLPRLQSTVVDAPFSRQVN